MKILLVQPGASISTHDVFTGLASALEEQGHDLVYYRLDSRIAVAGKFLKQALEDAGIAFETAELSMIPKNTMQLGEKETLQVMGIIDALEDLDDVQQVYSNLDISDEVMEKYEAGA